MGMGAQHLTEVRPVGSLSSARRLIIWVGNEWAQTSLVSSRLEADSFRDWELKCGTDVCIGSWGLAKEGGFEWQMSQMGTMLVADPRGGLEC